MEKGERGYGLLGFEPSARRAKSPAIEPASVLIKNTENAVKNWNLGPAQVDKPNDPYWAKAAKLFDVPVGEAKRRVCSNCEYFENTPEKLRQMESIPLNRFDIYGSPYHRGYCHKLHIICHTTRSCQAWEEKSYEMPE